MELLLGNGAMIAIDCTAAENEIADNRFERSELDELGYPTFLSALCLSDERNTFLSLQPSETITEFLCGPDGSEPQFFAAQAGEAN